LFRACETHKTNDVNSKAMSMAKEYFEKRGASPRIHRNMIAFLAADREQMTNLQQEVKMLLAWKSIKKDADTLNLDTAQRSETNVAIQEKEQSTKRFIQETWCHLIVPTQEGTNEIILKEIKIKGTNNPSERAIQKMKQDELLIDTLSPKILSMEMSKKEHELWQGKNHMTIRDLWANYTQYVYLHRLKDRSVLEKALEAGIRSGEYFYYAEDIDESGRYRSLVGSTGFLHLTLDGLIVKPEAARLQLSLEEKPKDTFPISELESESLPFDEIPQKIKTTISKKTHFWGSVKLDHTKLGSTAGLINTEILQHFIQLPGASVKISLDIKVDVPLGIPDDIVHIVDENRKTLKFDDSSGFE
jgi:uncharacterized protein